MTDIMSFIYRINKRGPKMDPCGTPDKTGNHLEVFGSTTTPEAKKHCIHCRKLFVITMLSNLSYKRWCGTLPKRYKEYHTFNFCDLWD